MQRSHVAALAAGLIQLAAAGTVHASSHMDAPKITLDDPANTTDVYAFISADASGRQYLTTALSVYPFEEPGIGPNAYRFDDNVRYSIHVALDGNVARGASDIVYEFDFSTIFPNQNTILQSYLGVVGADNSNRNLRQTYRVTKLDRRSNRSTVLGEGAAAGLITPPNNQGRVTPLYNQGDDGDRPAKGGVSALAALDPYTRAAVKQLGAYYVFAGQRDDAFYADIQSIFDLDFTFGADRATPTKPFDSQGGFNVHTIVLSIPLEELRAPARGEREAAPAPKLAGVYATTARRRESGRPNYSRESFSSGSGLFQQVGRQGNPLFVEALLPIIEKDRYNESAPSNDLGLAQYADNPELSQVLGATPLIPGLLKSIFIPDLIKIDLTTGPARLAGEAGFNRLSVFGGDVLKSQFQDPFANGGFIPGGWPNGRRFGDDVVDIAIIALGLAGSGPFGAVDADRVPANDITYNTVFPYAATPLNGRVHEHH